MVNENFTWNDHIHILENKLSKNIGLLYKAKPYVDRNTMTTLYFSFFHCYLNYGNIAWASTTKSKLRKIASQQRQAVNAIPKHDNQEITNLVIISCSTCCLVGPVKATWVCASFDSNLVIISCSTCCLVGPVKTTWV